MASSQPGDTLRKYARTGPGGAPLIETKPFQEFPPSSAMPARATLSTPGTARSRSATWSQKTGASGRCATVSSVRRRSAENPMGRWDNRSNVAANSPAANSTRKQKETWVATSACISRRRECGAEPPLSARAGFTADARSAGARPNRNITPTVRASPKARILQSAGSARRAGLSGGLILPTTNGADHHANHPPIIAARNASHALSTSTSCTNRHRPAPIATRRAISLARAAAWAVMRLATLAHAINSTSTASTARAISDRR